MEEKIKLIVWDFDKTLITGVLAEDESSLLNRSIFYLVRKFDEIGILQSICSRNDSKNVDSFLKENDVDEYFIHNNISWGMKSDGITRIISDFNVLEKNTVFIDDQIFERDEVKLSHPMIRTLDPDEAIELFDETFFSKIKVTKESSMRRRMYKEDLERNNKEEEFLGSHDEFLKTLKMRLQMREANLKDLDRVFELFERTHQLNSTGIIYSYDEIKNKMDSPEEKVLVLELEDRYGNYGIIGIVVVKEYGHNLIIEQLLLSCRIMSRGVGGFVLKFLKKSCQEKGYTLLGLFRKTEFNRIMEITYNFNGFKIREKLPSGTIVYESETDIEGYKMNEQIFDFYYDGQIV